MCSSSAQLRVPQCLGALDRLPGAAAVDRPKTVEAPGEEEPSAVAVEPATRKVAPSRSSDRAGGARAGRAPSAVVQGGKGRVVFRFYPASSKVVLDGRTLDTGGSNVVNRELSEGRHRLLLIGPDGAQRKDSFVIKSGKTTNLTTLHVTAR